MMDIELSKIFITWINFGVLILILKHFFWDKIKAIIEERQNSIEAKLIKADEDTEKARMYLVKNEQILQSARDEGKKITERQKEKGDKLYEELVHDAKTEVISLKERASLEIGREKEKAEYEIKKQAVDLAVELSIKALGQQIDEETHRKLIGDFIAKVGI